VKDLNRLKELNGNKRRITFYQIIRSVDDMKKQKLDKSMEFFDKLKWDFVILKV
jgi:hypothetical protein